MNLRLIFSLLVMVEFIVVVAFYWLAAELHHRFFNITLNIPTNVWLLFLSTIVGGGITTFLSRRFIEPIIKLGDAMSQVSKGDFSVRLEVHHPFKEIRDLYKNFNLMAEELSSTEILQTDFVSNVSHEFKTPINAIEGYATLLQNDSSNSPQEQAQYIDKILLNTRRLSTLVGNILLLSKVDNQAILSKQASFRLDEQIRQTIVMLEPAWDRKNLEFDIKMDEIDYIANESILFHIWNNLIGNAIKFSPENAVISLSLKELENEIEFTIEDHGPGISDSVKKHMFDKFYQGDSSHKQEGNGLGLALVKQIVTTYHGEITAENIPQGGCRVTVRLMRQP